MHLHSLVYIDVYVRVYIFERLSMHLFSWGDLHSSYNGRLWYKQVKRTALVINNHSLCAMPQHFSVVLFACRVLIKR